MRHEGFAIKTHNFEGPIELLLHLIEERKLPINEVSLVKVTDAYLGFLQEQKNFPLGPMSQFLVIAATLILIKSRSLLPTLALSDEETDDIADLERRLRIYKIYQEAEEHMRSRLGKAVAYAPLGIRNDDPLFAPPSRMSIEGLFQAVQDALHAMPSLVRLPKAAVATVVRVEEMIERLITRVTEKINVSFHEFANIARGTHRDAHEYKQAKVHTVVSFLAMLEMVRNGIIDVLQNVHFDDITIKKRDSSLPS